MKVIFALLGTVFLVAGAACGLSYYRYNDDATFWQEQARSAESAGNDAQAETLRSKAAAASSKNLLWGSGAGGGFVGGGVLILLSVLYRRSSAVVPRAPRSGGDN